MLKDDGEEKVVIRPGEVVHNSHSLPSAHELRVPFRSYGHIIVEHQSAPESQLGQISTILPGPGDDIDFIRAMHKVRHRLYLSIRITGLHHGDRHQQHKCCHRSPSRRHHLRFLFFFLNHQSNFEAPETAELYGTILDFNVGLSTQSVSAGFASTLNSLCLSAINHNHLNCEMVIKTVTMPTLCRQWV
ncbi:hypothetical protein Mapa_010522 [Marchantia paleacea]|nr:hypothetical protein Mapa_010522 [Marchantia paleacea]